MKNVKKEGIVIKKSGEKTINVLVSNLKRDTLYGKVINRTKKYLVHDENNQATDGDLIEMVECRPYSKRKTWRLSKIILAYNKENKKVEFEK